jgi:VWFA-related protein
MIPMRLGIGVSAVTVAALVAGQQAPTIRVPVRLVSVSTLVFSKEGRLIPGLEKTAFRVFDNGRLQQVTFDTASTPVAVAVAVQVNREVRSYLPFIAKVGSVIDTLLVGESGEATVIGYNGDVTMLKAFDTGNVQSSLKKIFASGRQARMIDAGMRAIALLKERPAPRARILLFVGQPMDSGSESSLASLKEQAERESVSVYALSLPEFGKAFVSDTFSLRGLPTERGGFEAGVDLGNLMAVLGRSSHAEKGSDPFSVLTAATGGTQIHFRRQNELEGAIATIGVELRSAYLLSYSPSSTEIGYHTVDVELTFPAPGPMRGLAIG